MSERRTASVDGRDGEIDSARDHHDRQPEHDQAEFRELPPEIAEGVNCKEARKHTSENDDCDQKHEERDRVVDPALRQYFPDQVIGEISTPQLGQHASGVLRHVIDPGWRLD
jgi:hypothetical protein